MKDVMKSVLDRLIEFSMQYGQSGNMPRLPSGKLLAEALLEVDETAREKVDYVCCWWAAAEILPPDVSDDVLWLMHWRVLQAAGYMNLLAAPKTAYYQPMFQIHGTATENEVLVFLLTEAWQLFFREQWGAVLRALDSESAVKLLDEYSARYRQLLKPGLN